VANQKDERPVPSQKQADDLSQNPEAIQASRNEEAKVRHKDDETSKADPTYPKTPDDDLARLRSLRRWGSSAASPPQGELC